VSRDEERDIERDNSGDKVRGRTDKIRTDKEKKEKKVFDFDFIWDQYPKKKGKPRAIEYFNKSVQTDQDYEDIQKALNNYLKSERVTNGYVKDGQGWFNPTEWRGWIDFSDNGKGNITTDNGKSDEYNEMIKAGIDPKYISETPFGLVNNTPRKPGDEGHREDTSVIWDEPMAKDGWFILANAYGYDADGNELTKEEAIKAAIERGRGEMLDWESLEYYYKLMKGDFILPI
jgi:hypothetical protein